MALADDHGFCIRPMPPLPPLSCPALSAGGDCRRARASLAARSTVSMSSGAESSVSESPGSPWRRASRSVRRSARSSAFFASVSSRIVPDIAWKNWPSGMSTDGVPGLSASSLIMIWGGCLGPTNDCSNRDTISAVTLRPNSSAASSSRSFREAGIRMFICGSSRAMHWIYSTVLLQTI